MLAHRHIRPQRVAEMSFCVISSVSVCVCECVKQRDLFNDNIEQLLNSISILFYQLDITAMYFTFMVSVYLKMQPWISSLTI